MIAPLRQFLDDQPEPDPERAYLLVMLVRDRAGGRPSPAYAVIPVHQPGGLWSRAPGALDPPRRGKDVARRVIEGVHGTPCGVAEQASGADACRKG